MANQTFKTLIEATLQSDERLWTKTATAEQPELNQTKLLDLIEKTDENVMTLLFKQPDLRKKIFVKIAGSFVFKINDFRFFMQQNKLNNSYTDYQNRIGLTDGKRFIKDTSDVVLNFPFKDTILQGGQSTEEGTDSYFTQDKKGQYKQHKAKRKEIFFNQLLAQDEIDRLLEPKALVHWKRYTKGGAQQIQTLKRDANGTLKENLIIKGNNLLALHSLKEQFAGKVKLIYIDPPYNTGNDSFNYNDNFNHSTWLTFMKNRLEIAKQLLRDDGVIFVQCDDNEQAYLKVLMDEVLGRENFVGTLIHQRAKGGGNAKFIVKGHDYLVIYSKQLTTNQKFIREKVIQSKLIERNGKQFIRDDDVIRKVFGKYESGKNRRCFFEELKEYKTEKQIQDIETKIENGLYELEDFGNGMQVIVRYTPIEESYSKLYSIVKALSENGTKHLLSMGINFDNPKPEEIIYFVINSCTNPDDIVLDYHLGSGTTAAVAHKMGRQYIGIEQMDYIETIAVERLKKVIAGEQGGISKTVNWQGGGDFVYCQLAEWNEQAKRKIESCQNLAELETLFNTLYEKYFLNYNLKIKEFKDNVLKEPAFRKLSLPEHQKIFVAMLDNNQMYTCKSEMADNKYNIASKDQHLTKDFYN